jgi:hypothetical protein
LVVVVAVVEKKLPEADDADGDGLPSPPPGTAGAKLVEQSSRPLADSTTRRWRGTG